MLVLSGPAPLPNAFNLGAELLDVFTSNSDDCGRSTISAEVEESVRRLVGTEMQNFSVLNVGARKLRFSPASNLDALPAELYPLLGEVFQRLLRGARALIFEN